MSAGELCTCPRDGHATRRPAGTGPGCGQYSADQELGGLCSSCATGWHVACDRTVDTMPVDGPYGRCATCGFNLTLHHAFPLPSTKE